jgi:hypothetical protein
MGEVYILYGFDTCADIILIAGLCKVIKANEEQQFRHERLGHKTVAV